jgi:hypothetical protein
MVKDETEEMDRRTLDVRISRLDWTLEKALTPCLKEIKVDLVTLGRYAFSCCWIPFLWLCFHVC